MMTKPGGHCGRRPVLDAHRQAERLRREHEILPGAIMPRPPLRRRIGLAFVSDRQAIVVLLRDPPGQAPAMAVQRMRHARRRFLDDGATAKRKAAVADAVRIRHQREAREAELGETCDAGLARGDQPVVARDPPPPPPTPPTPPPAT